jgi:hypothetical protein
MRLQNSAPLPCLPTLLPLHAAHLLWVLQSLGKTPGSMVAGLLAQSKPTLRRLLPFKSVPYAIGQAQSFTCLLSHAEAAALFSLNAEVMNFAKDLLRVVAGNELNNLTVGGAGRRHRAQLLGPAASAWGRSPTHHRPTGPPARLPCPCWAAILGSRPGSRAEGWGCSELTTPPGGKRGNPR